jgi:threonine dehydrogenase-like Zn-dependent dehydrogenase
VIDGAGDIGLRTSIAVDAGGAVHVSYVDFARQRLKYASDALGSWRTYDLDSAGIGPNGWGDTSIAVDRGGRVHIVYFAASGLRHATRP